MNSGDSSSDVIPTDVTEDKPTFIERRRPGRVHYRNQALIGLLRRPGSSDVSDNKGSPARGIVIGLGISALLWSAIGLIVWIVLKRW